MTKRFQTLGVIVALLAMAGGCTTVTSSKSVADAKTAGAAIYTWGNQSAGSSFAPTRVQGLPDKDIVQIVAINSASYALTSEGSVYAWGLGTMGQLGNGKYANSPTAAVRVTFPSGVTIAHLANPMPYNTGLAVDTKGNLWVWGYDRFGEACDAHGPYSRPTEVASLKDVIFATGAGDHGTFDEGGHLVSCGGNKDDDLGDGETTPSTSPRPVTIAASGTGRIVELTSSWANAGVLYSNGEFFDWGYNADGELGNGSMTNSDRPVHVPGDWTYVSEGGSRPSNGQSLAISRSGTIWGWGDDRWGQLCDGRSAKVTTPKVLPIKGTSVSSGGYSTYHIDNGDLYGCGNNRYGQVPSSPILTHVEVMQSTASVESALVG